MTSISIFLTTSAYLIRLRTPGRHSSCFFSFFVHENPLIFFLVEVNLGIFELRTLAPTVVWPATVAVFVLVVVIAGLATVTVRARESYEVSILTHAHFTTF